ncbi:MAG: UMP kinase [Alphaproteobacteria bacterium]|nr:UMP kinase [Alphaproteobacteria bacterium]
MPRPPPYRRVLLKISGEALAGRGDFGIDWAFASDLARDIAAVKDMGVQLCLVVGGGNLFRGAALAGAGVERASADHIGMLATVINALALQHALEAGGVSARVLSALHIQAVCEPYVRRRALRHLDRGRVVVFAAGTGNPFFSTDTAAALRAAEMGCDALLKATQVDGVYSSDPRTHPNAVRYDRLTYREVLSQDLRVMDAAAISLARESGIPILVFSIHGAGMLPGVIAGKGTCTVIGGGD